MRGGAISRTAIYSCRVEDYFESRVAPVEVASAGPVAGEDYIEPALVGSAPAGEDFPNWGN